ncbi:PREDICTED: prosaposin-like [Acropora digitifera]|uniref:prosaposin-like n=1 Tax=Acropora digitifera TaxID=70779 RepID=UPI00077A042A|nr:PREDICTED: prosaposin-like [Acropora digitifera]
MAIAFAVFVLFVASVSATPLLEDKCSWGPSYWCENHEQAVECKAVEHCRTNVWAVKDETACEICEMVVPKIKDFVSKNTTQAEVLTLLEQGCSEAQEFAAMCKSLVDQYAPVIMSNIDELMADPQKVCTALGLCTSQVKKTVAAQLIFNSLPLKKHLFAPKKTVIISKPYKASAACILCEYVITTLKGILNENSTKEEIEEAVEDVCSLFPDTIKSDCDQFVKQYEPAIVELLLQEIDPALVCTMLGVCASKEHRKALEKKVVLKVGSNETCEVCETAMTYLKNILADNATKQEILDLMKQICNYLPSQLAPECNAIVTEYAPAILDLIATAPPHTLCEEIGLCSDKKKGGGDFCFLGASFWCANKQNAVKCNAVNFCSDNVWH